MALSLAQGSWRWYQNDASEPSTAFAGQNVEPTLTSGYLNTVIRLRIAVDNLAGTAGSGAAKLQASTDNVNFQDFYGSGGSIGWAYGNGLGTDGAQVSTNLISGVSIRGNYHENNSGAESFSGTDTALELDFSFYPVNGVVSYGTRYYFRLVIGSTISTITGGVTHPSIIAPSAPVVDATATPSGVASTASVGSCIVTGGAVATPAGVAGTFALGLLVVALGGTPAGVEGTASVGTPTYVISSVATPLGVEGTGYVGTPDLAGELVPAAPTGVEGTASVGTATVEASSSTTVTGVSGASAVGTPTWRIDTTATPAGVSATGYVGFAYIEQPRNPTRLIVSVRQATSPLRATVEVDRG